MTPRCQSRSESVTAYRDPFDMLGGLAPPGHCNPTCGVPTGTRVHL